MHVVATAGHVDHGKSTLVDALTGMQSDRLLEEQRRGLSIELGYVWTTLGNAGQVAFVDVPGHERFLATMLSGVGPVPAALLVVAADDPWMPQTAEHLAALDAFGVHHGVVAVTRCDLADPTAAVARATDELLRTSLRGAPVVPVSARTGAGLDVLRAKLEAMVAGIPAPAATADVRIWIDRRFTVRGAGTVVTGTLPAGRIVRGDFLTPVPENGLANRPSTVRVRGMHSLGQPVTEAVGIARVALNVSGDVDRLERGSFLVAPDRWHFTDVVDVRVFGPASDLPAEPHLHVGAAATSVHVRPLGADLVRLRLPRALPLRVGDRAVLRDPGRRRVWGLVVLDAAPPALRRRGAAAERAADLADQTGLPNPAAEIKLREVVTVSSLERIGVPISTLPATVVRVGPWLISSARADQAAAEAARLVCEHALHHPFDPGLPLSVLAAKLDLPSPEVAAAVVRPPLRVQAGRVFGASPLLPEDLAAAVSILESELSDAPFAAPTATRLKELGFDARGVAAASRAGRLLLLSDGVVLLPEVERRSLAKLAELPSAFTASEARIKLGTSRRVVLALLGHLDQIGCTRRLPDDRRTLVVGQ